MAILFLILTIVSFASGVIFACFGLNEVEMGFYGLFLQTTIGFIYILSSC
jgi:hypothetical protein